MAHTELGNNVNKNSVDIITYAVMFGQKGE